MKLDYNVCLVHFPHSMAWWELGELICFSLRDLGFKVEIQHRKMESDCRNILLGAFLLEPEFIKKIPQNSIFINTEQLYLDDQKSIWPSDIYEWARNFETWDYSDKNIEKFFEHGIKNVKKLGLGYQKELNRIVSMGTQDIDVLFYGSIGDRRKKIIDDLSSEGMNVKAVFGVYGKERDDLIARSKVILNFHHYNSHIFEVVRVFYLLSNAKAVVGEVSESTSIDKIFLDSIKPTLYSDLVIACKKLVNEDSERHFLENKGFETFSKFPQSNYTTQLIEK
jgi:hypothetical protein